MCNVLQFQIEAAMLHVWLLMTSLAQLARWGVSLWPHSAVVKTALQFKGIMRPRDTGRRSQSTFR